MTESAGLEHTEDSGIPSETSPPEPQWVEAVQLARAFNRVALESFGGGLGAWIRRLVVSEKRWLSEGDYLSASTLCEVLPGSNQLNMAVFVGANRAGVLGAIAAVAGLSLVPALLAVSLGGVLEPLRGLEPVKHAFAGMAAASAGLALSVAVRQGREALQELVPAALTLATMGLVLVFRAPLWMTLVSCGLLGCWWARRSAGG